MLGVRAVEKSLLRNTLVLVLLLMLPGVGTNAWVVGSRRRAGRRASRRRSGRPGCCSTAAMPKLNRTGAGMVAKLLKKDDDAPQQELIRDNQRQLVVPVGVWVGWGAVKRAAFGPRVHLICLLRPPVS